MSRRRHKYISNEQDNGWSQAGLKVVTMLARRPEVNSKGVVDALQDVFNALDKKPKMPSKTYRELAATLKVVEEQALRYKKQRDQIIGACLLICESSNKPAKKIVEELLQKVKAGLGHRVLDKCRKEAKKII